MRYLALLSTILTRSGGLSLSAGRRSDRLILNSSRSGIGITHVGDSLSLVTDEVDGGFAEGAPGVAGNVPQAPELAAGTGCSGKRGVSLEARTYIF